MLSYIYIYIFKKSIFGLVKINNVFWNAIKYVVDLTLGIFLIISILLTHYQDTTIVKEMDNHIRKTIDSTKKNIIKSKKKNANKVSNNKKSNIKKEINK